MTQSDTASVAVDQSANQSQKPGSFLRAARKKQDLGIDEVADKLHLVPSSIRNIENDDYSGFQAEVYIKGYLRAYAKLLAIDPEDIVRRYDDAFSDQFTAEYGSKTDTRRSSNNALVRRKDSMSFIPMVGACAFLLVVAWLWFSEGQTQAEPETPALALQPVIIDQSDQTVVKQLAEEGGKVPVEDKLATQTVVASPEVESTVVVEPQLPSVSTSVSTSLGEVADIPASGTQASIEPVQSDQDTDNLFFSFTGDCWVEVKDMQDNVIYAALKKAEDTLSLDGNGPFKVLLGYAPGVTLNFNGERVEIDPNSRTNSARIVVGRS